MAETVRSRKKGMGGSGAGAAQAAGAPEADEAKKGSASMPVDVNSTPHRQHALRKELTEGACEKLFANLLAICIVTLCLWPLVKYGWL